MAKVILCCGRKAKTPYIIGTTGTKLYSVEELCCYIGRNIDILESSDLHRGLVAFFKNELDLPERAEYLEHLFESGATFKDIIVGVICSCDYYDVGEVEKILAAYDKLCSLTDAERRKRMADRLMKEGKQDDAAAIYKSLLSGNSGPEISTEEYGDICHNLAVIQIRKGCYQVAADTFLDAYMRNGNKESLKEYLFALKLAKKDELFSRERARLVDDRNLFSEINRMLEMVEGENSLTPESEMIAELNTLKQSGKYLELDRKLEKLIEELKKEYRSC